MTHPIEAFTDRIFANLRILKRTGPAEPNEQPCPHLSLSWGPNATDVSVQVETHPGGLFRISAEVLQTPHWFSLSIDLGEAVFPAGSILGLVIECDYMNLQGAKPDLPLLVRSKRSNDIADTVFGDLIKTGEKGQIQTLLHSVEAGDGLSGEAAWHTLVLQLPAQDFDLTIYDARVFVLSPAEAAANDLLT